jgi:DNA polymerase II small subunit
MNDDIILKFTNAELLIDDSAYKKIEQQENSLQFADSLIKDVSVSKSDLFILTGAVVDQFLQKNIDNQIISNYSPENIGLTNEGYDTVDSANISQSKLMDIPFNFQVLQDASKKSYTSGEIKDFTSYFNSRFQKLKKLLLKKPGLRDSYPMKDVGLRDDVVNVIGMVNDIRNTKNNHKIMEIEDETGFITVLIHNENHSLFEMAESIVKDEVIGVIGSKKGTLVIASDIIHPSVPRIEEKKMDFSAVFISDIHIGSSTFLEKEFQRFIKWINGDFGDEEQRKIANDVRYLVIAGDVVDGIGIYPHQEEELTIKNIYEQYEEAARFLGDINDIKIVIAPGNHDASRLAEPQPAIPEHYAADLYKIKNAEFVSNPSLVSLDGFKTLIYHGRSFDDLAMTINGLSHQTSDLIMKELIEKRHLAPIYGERTPLASEFEDHLVIDDIPDIFHTGHVHINAYKKHKGIHMINSGTFQSQTEFQKIYNIMPTCAEVPVLNRGSFKILKFT